MRGSWGRRGRRARRGRWRGRSEGQAGRHGVPRSPEGLFGLFTQYESIEEHEIHACTNIGVEATTAWIKTAASTQRAYYPSPAVSQGFREISGPDPLVVQGRPAVFRLVRELSPVISTAAAGFHTSCLGGRAMGGVRRRDAVVVAPSFSAGPGEHACPDSCFYDARARGLLVRKRPRSFEMPSVLQPAGSAF